MTEEKIYPDLKNEMSEEKSTPITSDNNHERQKIMLDKKRQLQKELQRYIKIKHKWNKANTVLRGINIVLTIILAGTGIALTGPLALPVVGMILTGVTAGNGVLNETLINAFIKRKAKRFKKKSEYIKNMLNKLSVFFEKCKEDGQITLEEFEGFHHILDEFEKMGSEADMLTSQEADVLSSREIKNINKKAKKDAKNEMANQAKQILYQKQLNTILQEYKKNIE